MAMTFLFPALPERNPRTVLKSDLKTQPAPPLSPETVTVTVDNWEDVYWSELKHIIFEPLLRFPTALDAVRDRMFAFRDEVFARHHLTPTKPPAPG